MIRLSITHYWTRQMRRNMNGADISRIERINEFGERNIELVNDEYEFLIGWDEDSDGNVVEWDSPF